MEPKNPKGEIVWVGHYDINHELKFITTSKPARDYYFLYEVINGAFVKLGKDRNPKNLEEKFITPEKLGIAPPEEPVKKLKKTRRIKDEQEAAPQA